MIWKKASALCLPGALCYPIFWLRDPSSMYANRTLWREILLSLEAETAAVRGSFLSRDIAEGLVFDPKFRSTVQQEGNSL
jgi:hypothetical protein